MQSPPSSTLCEWINEAHSFRVSDLTRGDDKKGAGGWGVVKTRREGRHSKMEEGFFPFFPPSIISLPFICHLLCVACQRLESRVDTGDRRVGSSRQREECLSADGSPWLLLGPRCQLLFCHSVYLTGK